MANCKFCEYYSFRKIVYLQIEGNKVVYEDCKDSVVCKLNNQCISSEMESWDCSCFKLNKNSTC